MSFSSGYGINFSELMCNVCISAVLLCWKWIGKGSIFNLFSVWYYYMLIDVLIILLSQFHEGILPWLMYTLGKPFYYLSN